MTTDGMCGVPHSFSGPGLWLDTITFTSCSVLIFSLFIITEVKKWSESCSGVSDSLRPHRLYSPRNSPGQNTGVGSLSLLQGTVPTQGSNLDLPHHRQILYQLSHKGSPRILELIAYPFSSRSSRPRNGTWVSCIAGRFFTSWTTRGCYYWNHPKPSFARIWYLWKERRTIYCWNTEQLQAHVLCVDKHVRNCSEM